MLFGDTDIDEAVGEPGFEGQESRRAGHGGGDGHDPGVGLGVDEERPGERVGVRGDRDVRRDVGATDRQ